MEQDVAAIILAGGKGTRTGLNSRNKVTLPFLGKPMVCRAVELVAGLVPQVVVVVGMYSDTVYEALKDYRVTYAVQEEQLGTGHATGIGLAALREPYPAHVLIGYGDHMMHYRTERIKDLLAAHRAKKEALTLVVSEADNVNELKYGRIIRNPDGSVSRIVEQKDADEATRAIREFNAGFYCASFEFLRKALPLIKPSPVTGEYYVTDLLEIAVSQGKKVLPYHIPFSEVGIGVNTIQDLEKSSKIERYGV